MTEIQSPHRGHPGKAVALAIAMALLSVPVAAIAVFVALLTP